MSKHTPGPWVFKCGTVYCTETRGSAGYQTTSLRHQVCKPPECIKTSRPTEAARNWEANANLIAAAPDLLEALQSLVKTMRSPPTGPGMTHEFDIGKAERAIAKALTGESK